MKWINWQACLIVISLPLMSVAAFAELAVIVHPDNKAAISKTAIRKIYLAKVTHFPDGKAVTPLDLGPGRTKDEFLVHIIKRSQTRLDTYWSRMLFSGKAAPPRVIYSEFEMRELVANNPEFIGYIDSSLVDASVRRIRFED